MMLPAKMAGKLDLLHAEGEGVVLLTTRLFSGEQAHHEEAQEGGVPITPVS